MGLEMLRNIMINIAYLVHSLRAGGIERSITRIVNRLDRSEFCPSIICLDKSGPAEQWLESEVPVIEIGKKSGNDLMAVRRLSCCLRDRNIGILQSHNWGTLLEGIFARKLSGTPFHIHAERGTVMGMVEAKGTRYWLRARAMSMALTQVNKVISNAHAVAERVQERCGYSAQKIEIIPNGVPEVCLEDRQDIRRQVRLKLGLDSESILIGSVGRLEVVKGFNFAMKAFATVHSSHPNMHLVLVGDGLERESLTDLAQTLGVSLNVHFVGRQSNVNHWLAALDIYLNSSLSEGMSQSIIEAMSAGLPIIATDVGDSAKILGDNEETVGMCVRTADPNALAIGLKRLVVEPELREMFAKRSKQKHSLCYSEEILVRKYQNLYRSVVGGAVIRP